MLKKNIEESLMFEKLKKIQWNSKKLKNNNWSKKNFNLVKNKMEFELGNLVTTE